MQVREVKVIGKEYLESPFTLISLQNVHDVPVRFEAFALVYAYNFALV